MKKILFLFSLFLIFIAALSPQQKTYAGWPACDGNDSIIDSVAFCLPLKVVTLPIAVIANIADGKTTEASYNTGNESRTAGAKPAVAKTSSGASLPIPSFSASGGPPSLQSLVNIPKENTVIDGASKLPLDIRGDAIKEAALSFGARGGLAWRTFHIRNELDTRARYLDKIYDFRQLLIPAPSGLLIEPPIVSEAMDAILVDNQGMDVALADRVLNINKNARIVTAPRTWRFYLERQWGDDVTPPPDILRPSNDKERAQWSKYVTDGWNSGVEQANDIFQADLNKLTADFRGMVRYRELLAQGMISAPYTAQTYRGVTGDGNTMRVGDRALEITDLPQLQTGSEKWQPVNR